MQVITPALAEMVALDRLRSLPRPPSHWSKGQRHGFDLRLRPVVRLASALAGTTDAGDEGTFRKGAKVDVFPASALRNRQGSREETYLVWSAERFGFVVTIDPTATRLASFQRTRVRRNGRRLEGPDAVIHGTLTVSDPRAFAELLAAAWGVIAAMAIACCFCGHRSGDNNAQGAAWDPQREGAAC